MDVIKEIQWQWLHKILCYFGMHEWQEFPFSAGIQNICKYCKRDYIDSRWFEHHAGMWE